MKVSDELRQVVATSISEFMKGRDGLYSDDDWHKLADAALTAAIPLILEEAVKVAEDEKYKEPDDEFGNHHLDEGNLYWLWGKAIEAGRAAERAEIREKLESDSVKVEAAQAIDPYSFAHLSDLELKSNDYACTEQARRRGVAIAQAKAAITKILEVI